MLMTSQYYRIPRNNPPPQVEKMTLFERGGLFEDGLYMIPKKNFEYKYNKIGLYFEIFSRGGIIRGQF